MPRACGLVALGCGVQSLVAFAPLTLFEYARHPSDNPCRHLGSSGGQIRRSLNGPGCQVHEVAASTRAAVTWPEACATPPGPAWRYPDPAQRLATTAVASLGFVGREGCDSECRVSVVAVGLCGGWCGWVLYEVVEILLKILP